MNCRPTSLVEHCRTEAELRAWLSVALPGGRITYHRGFLCRDCYPATSQLNELDRADLQRTARRARNASEIGLAHLVQLRNGADDYTYFVIARQAARAERQGFRNRNRKIGGGQ